MLITELNNNAIIYVTHAEYYMNIYSNSFALSPTLTSDYWEGKTFTAVTNELLAIGHNSHMMQSKTA